MLKLKTIIENIDGKQGAPGNLNLEKERLIVERAKNEVEAFGELYNTYYSRIFGYILKRTANVHVAEDITSEVFISALNNICQFRWRGLPFSSWLYRIAANEIANHFRKNKARTLSLEESLLQIDTGEALDTELIQAEESLARHQEFLALHDNISKLSLKYQEVIVLRYFEEKQLNEIGEILGKPEGTVKALLHRGLEKLRKLM